LDESKQRRNRILSVGGVVAELADLPDVEEIWREAREEVGITPGTAIKYSMSWPGGPGQRARLIATIGQLPLKAVIALLEDFRPLGMRARKATRKDAYIQRRAFEWSLQRLAGDLYSDAAEQGPHLVMIDSRDDFKEFREVYALSYEKGWPGLPHHPVPALRDRGFSASLGECSNGPMHEIADLLTSCTTRWADERCMAHKGGHAPDRVELDDCMTTLIDLFPIGKDSVPPRRRGHSIVVHAGNRTGKEILHGSIDRWANELKQAPGPPSNDMPF
jgi:hypothetical protein